MSEQRASVRVFGMGAAAALALVVLGFAARPARAQVQDCFPPFGIPTRVVNAVEAAYPLDEFADPTCENAAKQSTKGCKKGVRIAAKCRNLVNEARNLAQNLACLGLTDKAAQKACTDEHKAEFKEDEALVKDQTEEGSAGCADDVAPAIIDACADDV